VRLGLQFAAETKLGRWTGATAEMLEGVLLPLIFDLGAAFLAIDDDGQAVGLIACVVVPSYFSGELIADELAWYVAPESRTGARVGIQLLAALEDWTSTRGAHVLKVGSPYGSSVGTFLERRDFEPVEVVHLKRLRHVVLQ
jgi:GNAT superfamily N-acetyltransferase